MIEAHSRREVVADIAAILCLAGMRGSSASEPTVNSDEGVVICGWRTEVPSRFLKFKQFHSRQTFLITNDNREESPTPAIAKLGRYYLNSFDEPFNAPNLVFSQPADEHGTFEVLSGVVNYIGDWDTTLQGVKVTTNYDSIFWAKRAYPWIEKYQLFISLPGRESYARSWTLVQRPSRPPPPPPPRPQIFPH